MSSSSKVANGGGGGRKEGKRRKGHLGPRFETLSMERLFVRVFVAIVWFVDARW